MECVLEPWMSAFRRAKCITGWVMTGLYPFTLLVYWEGPQNKVDKRMRLGSSRTLTQRMRMTRSS
eukprot:662069-Rhodomonas_salina.1